MKCFSTRWRTEGKWRGNWRMQWVASTLHTTSEHGVSSITTADAHTSAASCRLNWRSRVDLNGSSVSPKDENLGFCACAITFQIRSNCSPVPGFWNLRSDTVGEIRWESFARVMRPVPCCMARDVSEECQCQFVGRWHVRSWHSHCNASDKCLGTDCSRCTLHPRQAEYPPPILPAFRKYLARLQLPELNSTPLERICSWDAKMFQKLPFPGNQSLLRCSIARAAILTPEPVESTSHPISVKFILTSDIQSEHKVNLF